jgi:3'(2'), 5'-bisphosphate nucleotidase
MIETLMLSAISAAYDAGLAIMEVYENEFDIEYKQDLSPLTLADKRAHQIVSEQLSSNGIPILSEEGAEIQYIERKAWTLFWMVDPLDGTKEFIKRNGDFTVNIALIENQVPIAGVIFAPVPDLVYYALPTYGAFRIEGKTLKDYKKQNLDELIGLSTRLPVIGESEHYCIVASRSHQNKETMDFIESVKSDKKITFLSIGSSLKFCAIAEGTADLYPRMGPTMEWDTAAGHAIAIQSGCSVLNVTNGSSLLYNKESLLNPYFVVKRK